MDTDERRAQLLELGMDLFAERPFDEVSIDDIAQAAGVSKGLLYHYFGSKRAYYVQTVQAGCEALLEACYVGLDLPTPERARAGITAYLNFASDHGAAYLVVLKSGVGVDEHVVEVLESTRRTFSLRMLEGLGVEPTRPVFRTLARTWVGSVEAATMDWLEHRDIDRDTMIELLLRMLGDFVATAIAFDPDANVELA